MDRLRADYMKMQSIIYGASPDFDEMMRYIKELEGQINAAEQKTE